MITFDYRVLHLEKVFHCGAMLVPRYMLDAYVALFENLHSQFLFV